MGHLDALNIVTKPNMRPVTSQDQKRFKLIIKLQEQLSMIEAELTGKGYKRLKWVTRLNAQGEHERIQRPVRVKQWWFKDWAGNMFFAIRYGANALWAKQELMVQQGERNPQKNRNDKYVFERHIKPFGIIADDMRRCISKVALLKRAYFIGSQRLRRKFIAGTKSRNFITREAAL